MVGGPVRNRAGAQAAFLLEVGFPEGSRRKPAEVRLGGLGVARAWLTFSPDGGTAVWSRCDGDPPLVCELWAKDLRDAASPPWPTGIPIHLRKMRWSPVTEDPALTFNDDGTLLAVAEEQRLIVYDFARDAGATRDAAPRVVASVDAEEPSRVTFLPGNRVRFHQLLPVDPEVDHDSRTRIRQLDLGTRRLVDTGRLPPTLPVYGGVLEPARDILFLQRLPPFGPGLYDGESGRLLVEIEKLGDSLSGFGRFLADGRLIVGQWSRDAPGQGGGKLTLLVLSPEGQELHRIERAGVRMRRAGSELAPGRLLIALNEAVPAPAALHRFDVRPLRGWTTYMLDADSGELKPLAAGVLPLARSGKSAPSLFLAAGQILRWNIETGEVRTVLAVER